MWKHKYHWCNSGRFRSYFITTSPMVCLSLCNVHHWLMSHRYATDVCHTAPYRNWWMLMVWHIDGVVVSTHLLDLVWLSWRLLPSIYSKWYVDAALWLCLNLHTMIRCRDVVPWFVGCLGVGQLYIELCTYLRRLGDITGKLSNIYYLDIDMNWINDL